MSEHVDVRTAVIPQIYTTILWILLFNTHAFDSTILSLINRTLSSGNVFLQRATHTRRDTILPVRSPVCYLPLFLPLSLWECVWIDTINSTERIENEQWMNTAKYTKTTQHDSIQYNTSKHLTKPPLSLSSTTTTRTAIRISVNNNNGTEYTTTTTTTTTTTALYERQKCKQTTKTDAHFSSFLINRMLLMHIYGSIVAQ